MDFCRSPENASRNRYTDVLCLDQTRVKLGQECGNSQLSDYINANFVDGFKQNKAYIATQGRAIHTIFFLIEPQTLTEPTTNLFNQNVSKFDELLKQSRVWSEMIFERCEKKRWKLCCWCIRPALKWRLKFNWLLSYYVFVSIHMISLS